MHTSKSSDAVPSSSKTNQAAGKNVGASDLVLAFERTYGLSRGGSAAAGATAEDAAGRTRLTKQELDMLLSKETLRMPSKGKKKAGVQDLFGNDPVNADTQLQNWQQLGTQTRFLFFQNDYGKMNPFISEYFTSKQIGLESSSEPSARALRFRSAGGWSNLLLLFSLGGQHFLSGISH